MTTQTKHKKIEWRGGINWDDFFEHNGYPGGADLVCGGTAGLDERIGELILSLLFLRKASGDIAYQKIVVVLPPDVGGAQYNIIKYFNLVTQRIRGKELDEKELEIIKKRVNVIHADSLESHTLVSLVESASPRTFIVIIEGALYRNKKFYSSVFPVGSSRFDEDLWVPHLHALTLACINAAMGSNACVLIDAGQFFPQRQSNFDLLHAIEPCGLIGLENENRLAHELVLHADKWVALVKAGRTTVAMENIDALPTSMNAHKLILKIQMLHRGGATNEAVEIIRSEIKRGNRFDAPVRVRLASIAAANKESEIVESLLSETILHLSSEVWLELALTVSRNLSLTELAKECVERLEKLFPNSIGLYDHRVINLFFACQQTTRGVYNTENVGNTEFQVFASMLVTGLQVEVIPDYYQILDGVASSYPEHISVARLGCAINAEKRKLPIHAIKLAKPSELSGGFAERATRTLLWAIEVRLLANGKHATKDEYLESAVMEVLQYLASNPDSGGIRLHLSGLMSVQVSASLGVSLLAYSAISFYRKTLELIDDLEGGDDLISNDDFEKFFTSAFDFLEKNGPVNLGDARLPNDILVPSADSLLNRIVDMVNHVGGVHDSDEDLKFLQQLIAVGSAIAPHARRSYQDIEMLRLAAGKMMILGQMQLGRDYAEHALTICRDDPLRTRLAWFTFADVYQRCQNHVEALIGMACALANPAAVTPQQAFYETYGLIRLLRDVGLIEIASSFLPACETLLDRLKIRDQMSHRLETIKIGLSLRGISDSTDSFAISQLAELAEANLRVVLERNDEVLPVAVLFSQILQLCDNVKVTVKPAARALLDQASVAVGENSASLMKLVSNDAPTAAEVFEWVKKTESARYSEDVGYDVRTLVGAARRLLSSEEAATSPSIAAFAAELTTDHGVGIPGSSSSMERRPQWLASTITEAGQRAAEISLQGISVSLLALDERKQLVRITAQDGNLGNTVYEDETVFSHECLTRWSKTFPFAYGMDNDDGNLFYNSVRGLGLTVHASARAVFILDTQLQRFPLNLILVCNELMGLNTRLAVAPSLAWLHAAMTSVRTMQGSSVAWISTAVSDSSDGTLAMVAARLADSLQAYGIDLHTGAEMPKQLEGAELAIVAAHGGVASEGRYFQVIADEDKLSMTSVSLSRALKNVGVAILFVCSGGRFDKHPNASTTVGLPKELLDRGCSAVLASPWPLDSRVPSHWLPAFLEAWNAGEMIIDANYMANQAVKRAMGDSPALCMAMTLYGNPLLVRQKTN